MVGALADWFAVTALFRRPLGLPIPHTAIIPRNKDRVGASLANFLQHNLMTEEVAREELGHVDFAGTAARWLNEAENRLAVAKQIAGSIPTVLRLVRDEDVGPFLKKGMTDAMRDLRLAPFLAQVFSLLMADRRHHALFDYLLGIVIDGLDQHRDFIRQKVHENSPRWIPKTIDEKFFVRLLEELHNLLFEMKQENSELRARFQNATEEFIENLKTSPEYEKKIQDVIADLLANPLFRDYADQVWRDVKSQLLDDAASDNSRMVHKLDDIFRTFSGALLQDAVARDKLNNWVRNFVTVVVVERRNLIADLVKRVIQKWDAEKVSRKFELYVGRDLQYIRINGTLVGGVVGLALHVFGRALQ
jgi:uncharacterized membrane-anchored protein YjiN (DUF445 family)